MLPLLEAVADEAAELLTGERRTFEVDRVLTTMLFTDIVDRRNEPRRWATSAGDRCSTRTTTPCVTSSTSIAAAKSKPAATVSLPPSTARPAPFAAPGRSSSAPGSSGSNCAPGLHTGECEVRGNHLGGLAVHIAARVGQLASSGEVLVSGTVKDLVVGSEFEFTSRGEHQLKGVPDTWKLYAVAD
jgi:class 3 adenylate cyclase